VAGLRDVFSEYALIKYRVLVEVRWLQVWREDSCAVAASLPSRLTLAARHRRCPTSRLSRRFRR
jgi:adenylosuccinate lyase